MTEQFRSIPEQGAKVLALDDAHKFMDGIKSDGLSEAIVNVARLMRHDGIRLAVSTQSPKALAPEVLELVSIATLHHFHSQDWWISDRSFQSPTVPLRMYSKSNDRTCACLCFSSQFRLALDTDCSASTADG